MTLPDCRCGDSYDNHVHLSGSRRCSRCGCRGYMMPLRVWLRRVVRRFLRPRKQIQQSFPIDEEAQCRH